MVTEFSLLLSTASLYEGKREPETVVEDIFIRKFMTGTWHNLFVSEVRVLQPCMQSCFVCCLSYPHQHQNSEHSLLLFTCIEKLFHGYFLSAVTLSLFLLHLLFLHWCNDFVFHSRWLSRGSTTSSGLQGLSSRKLLPRKCIS